MQLMPTYSREMSAYRDSRPSPMQKLAQRNTQYATAKIIPHYERRQGTMFAMPNFDLVNLTKRHSLSYANAGKITTQYNYINDNVPNLTNFGHIKPMER